MKFGSMPESLPAIATRKVKWDRRYQQKYGITTSAADDLDPAGARHAGAAVAAHLSRTGPVGLRADGFSGVPGQRLYVLEAN